MSNYVTHARREFRAVGWMDKNGKFDEGSQKWMCDQIIELLELFSTHGHSGTSAPYAINLFSKLAKFKPIVPLTGEDEEWNKCGDGSFQNNRCSHVFREGDRTYDIQGKVFREPDGCCYTNSDSRVDINFPYTPKTEYVDVEPKKEGSEGGATE
ncbi:MAG: hypothetical protein KAR42_17765 [candidate division Zixibacteria bacterium]|nr:hypothetical protein [candidate division Zixibacteria bacterium]